MPITHLNRKGVPYYLHSGAKRGGGTQLYFSQKKAGTLVDEIPEGYVIHEHVDGMVYLRRRADQLVTDEEIEVVRAGVKGRSGNNLYAVDFKKDTITIHESERNDLASYLPFNLLNAEQLEARRMSRANYMAVMRFQLIKGSDRLFSPERFCFRGSVDDWIGIGPPAPLPALVKKYTPHLGKDSIYELY